MTQTSVARAIIDGVSVPYEEAGLAITDDGVARGDGAFETIGVWDGRPFRLADHLTRLAFSLNALGLPAADLDQLESEARSLTRELEAVDARLRIYVTGSGTRVVTLTPADPLPPASVLVPQPAPWIRPLGTYGPAGAKTMSYAVNMAATRAARREGGDDALLVSLEGYVLEGPTFGVVWVDGDVVRAPARDLGIVDSISRRTVLEAARSAGLRVDEGWFGLDALTRASDLLTCSATRPLRGVARVGDIVFEGGSAIGELLAKALDSARRSPA